MAPRSEEMIDHVAAIYGASEARGVLRTRRGGAVRRELRLHGAPSSGLVRENDSVAARILDRMGVSLVELEVRSSVRSLVVTVASSGHAANPRAKRVIDLAYDEARQLSNNYIGTEHLLLGLIREGEGLAGRVLAKLAVELERTRREVMALQDNDSGMTSTKQQTGRSRTPTLDDLGEI